jgi:RHS repeat-associated protein
MKTQIGRAMPGINLSGKLLAGLIIIFILLHVTLLRANTEQGAIDFAQRIISDLIALQDQTGESAISKKTVKQLDKDLKKTINKLEKVIEKLEKGDQKKVKKEYKKLKHAMDKYINSLTRKGHHGKKGKHNKVDPEVAAPLIAAARQIQHLIKQLIKGDIGNSLPIANAGRDQSANSGQTVTLNGSDSTDADRDILQFKWTVITRPEASTAVLVNPQSVTPSITAYVPGIYVIQLIVSDSETSSVADAATISISSVNTLPVADAGVDQTGLVAERITLDASGSSDADGNILTYSWLIVNAPPGSNAALNDPTLVRPTFDADLASLYEVELFVNDGEDNSPADRVSINIDILNTRPIANAGLDQSVFVNDLVQLDGSASTDVDGDPLTWLWSLTTVPLGSQAELDDELVISPTFTADYAGQYVAALIVFDGEDDSAPDSVIINSEIQNTIPTADAGLDQSNFVGNQIILDGSGSADADHDPLTFEWSFTSIPAQSNATLVGPTLEFPTFVLDVSGDYVAQLTVNDGLSNSSPDEAVISTENSRPVANAGMDKTVVIGESVNLSAAGSNDADGNSLSWQWSITSQPEDSIAGLIETGIESPVFLADEIGIYIFQLIVSDGSLDSIPDTIVVIVEEPPNLAPVINSVPVTFATVGVQYSYDVDATDPENNGLTYSLILPPVSMSIDAVSGLIRWTPIIIEIVAVTVQVSDNQGGSTSQSFSINVAAVNLSPVITSTPVLDAETGMAYSYAVVADDPEDNPITFNLIQSPVGMSISSAGMVSWQPDNAGTYAIEILVADNRGGSVSQSFNILVAQANQFPVITSVPVTTATAGTEYRYTTAGSDPDGDTLSFTLINLPTGMVIENTGLITWLPTLEGSYPVLVQASDGLGGTTTQAFVIAVTRAPNLPPTITSTPTINAGIDTDYVYQVLANDPNNDSLNFSFSNKPLGMNVNASGLVSWKPVNDGQFSATINVDDGRGGFDSQSFDITVTGEAAQTPTLESLDNQIALLGRTLTLQLLAADPDNDAIEFFVAPLPLPANMQLDSTSGIFTFTPTAIQVGDFSLKFIATDGRFYAEQTITITVPPPAGVTQLRGQVLTSNNAPLPGVRLEMGGLETTTDQNGDFFLDKLSVSGHARLLVDGNAVDPSLGSFATVPEMINIIEGTENLLLPAIFLLPLDVASADPVTPAQTSIVTSSRFTDGLSISEPVTLTIPPGRAIDDNTGLPFSGDIHISRVTDPTKGPRPLPEDFDLSVYIAIQPFGVTYPVPVPISFPNVEGFPPDSRMDFFALNHETGVMEKIGEGLVSADGKTVDSIGGIVKSNSWHGMVPQGPVASPNNPPGQNEPEGCNVDAGCKIDRETGNLSEWHTLPAYSSLQQARFITLEYNSNNANPRPILPLISGFGNRAPPPDLMSMRINIDGINMGKEVFSSVRVEQSNVRGQFKTTRPAIQFNATMIDTGIYNYDLDINCYFPQSRRLGKVSDQVIIHNESNSTFGAGWTIVGLQRIYEHSSGRVMLTEGTATSLIFEPMDPAVDPNGFDSPPGDFSTLSRAPDTTLERRMKNGMRHRFDATGLMIESIDRNNNVTTYNYDPEHRLIEIVDPVGQSFNLIYSSGKLASISDPLNRTTSFEHDSQGNLTAIIEPNGDRRSFEYAANNNRMIAQIDQRQNRTEYFYDFAGRISETILPDGSNPQFNIGQTKGLANLATEGQPGDGSRELPTPAPLLLEEVNNEYMDHNGNSSMIVTDLRHRPLSNTDAVGRVYSYSRDEDSNPTRKTRPNNSTTDNTFDDHGNRLTKIENFNTAQTQTTYDAFSFVTSYSNPNSHLTTYNRDTQGNVTSMVNHLGHATTYEYDNRGLVTRLVTPNQLEITYAYNATGLTESITDRPPAGSPGNIRVTRFSYDAAGQMIQTVTPEGITLIVTYDDKGRMKRITDNLNQVIEYNYDAYNNQVQTDTKNSDGSLALTVQKVFDVRNRFIETSSPHIGAESSVAQQALDNNSNIVGSTDPNGNDASNQYDGENRLISNTHRLNGVTSYEYDTNDRIVEVTAPNGARTAYTYDLLGRRQSETSPDRGQTSYNYDVNNNVTSITDGRGITTTMSYDGLERLVSKTYPNTIAGKAENVIYTYDNCPFGTGRLCQRIDESGTWEYAYDTFGNVMRETKVELGVTYSTGYEYDDDDNITQTTYPAGRVVNFNRDGVRRIKAISTDINSVNSSIVSDIQYRIDNQMTQCTFGNGLVDNRSYDLQGRLLSQNLAAIDSRTYSYDKNSNMLSRNTTPQTSVYSYDALDRLTGDQIDSDDAFTYQYDLNHNRQAKTQSSALAESYDYQSSSNRLVRHSQFTAASLPATVNDRQYVYSDSNRIFQVIDNGLLSAQYIYNDNGQRTRKLVYDNSVAPAVTSATIYHYDLMGYLIAESDETGVAIKDYIWAEGMNPVAQIDISNGTDSVHYLHTDHLMTPRFATTSSQQVSWRWEGESFGGAGDQELQTDVNLRFPGQYFDKETGDHYNWNRYYNPSLGRYLESDRIGLGGGINTFGYVSTNPLKYIDPYGLEILLQTHPVGLGNNHSKTTIILEPNSRFNSDPRFANETSDGRKFATLGAGPSGFLAFGTLKSDPNRERDIDLAKNNYSSSVFTSFCPSQDLEDDYIQRLFDADSKFDDSKFDYELFPGKGEHNSNSYANGLLRSVGLVVPAPPSAPGFNRPVSSSEFR